MSKRGLRGQTAGGSDLRGQHQCECDNQSFIHTWRLCLSTSLEEFVTLYSYRVIFTPCFFLARDLHVLTVMFLNDVFFSPTQAPVYGLLEQSSGMTSILTHDEKVDEECPCQSVVILIISYVVNRNSI